MLSKDLARIFLLWLGLAAGLQAAQGPGAKPWQVASIYGNKSLWKVLTAVGISLQCGEPTGATRRPAGRAALSGLQEPGHWDREAIPVSRAHLGGPAFRDQCNRSL